VYYLLGFLLFLLLILGLFWFFLPRIIIWGASRFGVKFSGEESLEKTKSFLTSRSGKLFILKQRVKGIFYILIVAYVVTLSIKPEIVKYLPWYILFIPLAVNFILYILLIFYSHRDKSLFKE